MEGIYDLSIFTGDTSPSSVPFSDRENCGDAQKKLDQRRHSEKEC